MSGQVALPGFQMVVPLLLASSRGRESAGELSCVCLIRA